MSSRPPRLTHRVLLACLLAGLVTTIAACAEDPTAPSPRPAVRMANHALQAYCTVTVEQGSASHVNYGDVDMETVYLPRVVRCENGGVANDDTMTHAQKLEALKVQAVAARGYAYYRMSTGGSLAPDTSDQKYDCGGDPTDPIFQEAVTATAGQYLEYNATIVAAFYVAGARPENANTCNADHQADRPTEYNDNPDSDYSNTEHYVTYNEGRSWDGSPAAEQTTLGWVNGGNFANRGCSSQNGARCLAKLGWDHDRILRFYYGENIGLPFAQGPCVGPPPMCEIVVDGPETIIDQTDSPCFTGGCVDSSTFNTVSEGYGGSHIYTFAWDQGVDCSGRWSLNVATAGEYDVDVWIETTSPLSTQAPYTIRHNGTNDVVAIDMAAGNGSWVSLGRFDFAVGEDQYIELVDATGEPYTGISGKRIVFDAVRLQAVVPDPPVDPGPSDDIGPPADTSSGGPMDTSSSSGGPADTSPPADTSSGGGADTSTPPDDVTSTADSSGAMMNDASDDTGEPPVDRVGGGSDDDCGCRVRAGSNNPTGAPAGLGATLLLLGFALVVARRRKIRA